MNERKPKVIKKDEIENSIHSDRVALIVNLFRWLKLDKPDKAKDVLQILQNINAEKLIDKHC